MSKWIIFLHTCSITMSQFIRPTQPSRTVLSTCVQLFWRIPKIQGMAWFLIYRSQKYGRLDLDWPSQILWSRTWHLQASKYSHLVNTVNHELSESSYCLCVGVLRGGEVNLLGSRRSAGQRADASIQLGLFHHFSSRVDDSDRSERNSPELVKRETLEI